MIGFERHEMFKRGGGARAGERRTISLPVIPRTANHQGVHIHEASFQVIGVSGRDFSAVGADIVDKHRVLVGWCRKASLGY
jgi:hypothetical protein